MHFSVNTDGTLRICCNTSGAGVIKSSEGKSIYIDEISSPEQGLNLDYYKKVRLQMLNGEEPSSCRRCFNTERNGGKSLRQIYRELWEAKIPDIYEGTGKDGSVDAKIHYLDFSLSNTCNLKCRMCNPVASHSLYDDFKKLGLEFSEQGYKLSQEKWKLDESFKTLVNEMLPSLEEMLFTGGEPFLSKQQVYILEQAVELGLSHKIILRYHSNVTVLPEKLIELWKHFKQVEVHCSVEAHGLLNDYIRFPSKWAKVDEHLRKLLALKTTHPLRVEIHTCFQALSILRLKPLFDYLLQFEQQMPIYPHLIFLDRPDYLGVKALPLDIRMRAKKEIFDFIEQNQSVYFQGPFASINQDKHRVHLSNWTMIEGQEDVRLTKEFVAYNKQFDQLREQKLIELIPEMQSLM